MSSTAPVVVRFDNNPLRWDMSPWVNRLEALLTFSRSSFELEKRRGDSRSAPRGKLPVVKVGQGSNTEVIPDSLFAYEELVKRGLANELDVDLSPEDQAKSRALLSLVEENYQYMTTERWMDEFQYARDGLVLKKLWYPLRLVLGYWIWRYVYYRVQAWGLHRPASEVNSLRNTGVDAIATMVGDNKHILGGDAPTRVDALVFGYIAAIYANPRWVPKLLASVKAHPNLTTYAEGLRATWFPDRPSFL